MDFTLPIEKSSSRTEKWIFNHFNETGHLYDITSEFNSHKLIIHPVEPELPPLKSEANRQSKLSSHDNILKAKANASTSRLKKLCLEAGPSMNYSQSRNSIVCTTKSYVLCTSTPKLMTPFPINNFSHTMTFDKHKLSILNHNTAIKSDKATLFGKSIESDLHLRISIKSSDSFPNLGYYQMQGSSKLTHDLNQFISPNPISILPFWPINTTYKGLDANKPYHKQPSIPSKSLKSHDTNKQGLSMQHYSMPHDSYQTYGMKSHIDPSIAYWCWVRQAQIQAQMQLQMQMLTHPLHPLNPYKAQTQQPIAPPFSFLQKHLLNHKSHNCDVTWCVINNIQPSSLPLTTETMGENHLMRDNSCDESVEAKTSDDIGRHYSSSYAYWNPKRKSFAPVNVLNQKKEQNHNSPVMTTGKKNSLSNFKNKARDTKFNTTRHQASPHYPNNLDASYEEEEHKAQPEIRSRSNTNDVSPNQNEIRSVKRFASSSCTLIPGGPSPSTVERSPLTPAPHENQKCSSHLEYPTRPTVASSENYQILPVFKMEEQMKYAGRDDTNPYNRDIDQQQHQAHFPSPFYYNHHQYLPPAFFQHHQPDPESVSGYDNWYQALRHQYVAAVMASTAHFPGTFPGGPTNPRSETPNGDVSPLITEENSPISAPASMLLPPYFPIPSFAPNIPSYFAPFAQPGPSPNGALEQQQQFYAAAAYYYQAAYATARANHESSGINSSFIDEPKPRISENATIEMSARRRCTSPKIIGYAKLGETSKGSPIRCEPVVSSCSEAGVAAIVVAAAESTTSSPSAPPGLPKSKEPPLSPSSGPTDTTPTTVGIKKTSFKIWRQFGQTTSTSTPSLPCTPLSVTANNAAGAGLDKNFVKQQFNLNHILENLKSQQAALSHSLEPSPYHGNHHASTASILAAARNEKFVCATCSKVFQKQSQLSLHMNVHFFERPFRCEGCNQRFRIKGLLTKHKCPSKGSAPPPSTTTRCSGSNFEAPFCVAHSSGSSSSTLVGSGPFEFTNTCYSTATASKSNAISSPYLDSGSTPNGQGGVGSMATSNDPRPFKCEDCQVAFRIQGHLAKHLRSKMHITGLEKNGKVPSGTYAFFDQRASLNDIDTTSCSASLGSLHRLLQQNNCSDADLNATSQSVTSLPSGINGHTNGLEKEPSPSLGQSVKTTPPACSKKRALVESGEENSNASFAPDMSENPASISQTHNLEILCSATKYRKKINV